MKILKTTALFLLTLLLLGGCATLDVTPQRQLKTSEVKLPVTVAIQTTGERLRDAFNDPAESAIKAASGKLFNNVLLLPADMRFKTPAEIKTTYGADYILTIQLTDVNVHGSLNPLWFATIPLLIFKPLAPIVTFESTVTLDCIALDVNTGATLVLREVSETSTDHFSPKDPQEKVRKLTTRSLNGALVTVLEELKEKLKR